MYKLLVSSLLPLICVCFEAFAEPLKIARGDGQYPPYEWTENDQLRGIHIDLIRKASLNLGINIQILDLPWSRALLELEAGSIDALTFIGKNSEREKYTMFLEGNVLSESKLTLFRRTQKTKFVIDSALNKLNGKKVAVSPGFFYGETFDLAKNFEKVGVKSYTQMLNVVYLERVDFGIVNQHELMFNFKDDPKLPDIEFISPPVAITESYIGFSKKAEARDTAEKFAREIKNFRNSGFYETLMKRYGLVSN